MTVLNKTEHVVCFDVDDTLIKYPKCGRYIGDPILIPCPYVEDHMIRVWKHETHIHLLKKQFNRGRYIIVWSHGGAAWANAVVKALGLEKYVDLILTKPMMVVDDLPIEVGICKSIYLEDNHLDTIELDEE